ncbi:hypothetical protein GCM10027612_10630 [Microbispora bryophytorum subsp. camponoti]
MRQAGRRAAGPGDRRGAAERRRRLASPYGTLDERPPADLTRQATAAARDETAGYGVTVLPPKVTTRRPSEA